MAYQAQTGTDLRGLKALVGFLGVLIVIGTAVVIGVVIKRIYGTTPAVPSITSAVIPGMPAAASLPAAALAPGEHIAGIAGAGGEFAVWVSGAKGDRLLLLNPQTGAFSTILQPGQ
jgi:hypothetical protein